MENIKQPPDLIRQITIGVSEGRVDQLNEGDFYLSNAELKNLYQVASSNDMADGDRILPKHVIVGKDGKIFYIGNKLESM
jgi:hypothetical protein